MREFKQQLGMSEMAYQAFLSNRCENQIICSSSPIIL